MTSSDKIILATYMEYPTRRLAGRITDVLADKMYNDYNSIMAIVQKLETERHEKFGYVDFIIFPDAIIVVKENDDVDSPLILINKSEGFGSLQSEETIILFEEKLCAIAEACLILIKHLNTLK